MVKWALLALVVLAVPGGAEEGFFWPLRLEPALSSTFGETRAMAFHAGMDVKTWGKTGYEVQALANGYIWRVRTSPWGYGRAIYLKLLDGRTVVYGHLERFAPQIAERVLQAQLKRGSYSVDLYFNEGDLLVEGGELIAWSGQSGAGPPHLHLELRDADNVPVNPLLHGFAIADTIAPTLQRIAITPYGSGAQVESGYDPYVSGLRFRPERGEFTAAKPIQVHGWVGVSVLMYDRADGAPNKLAPYSAALELDGRSYFAAQYDRVSYADMHQIALDRSLVKFAGGAGRFFNLCRLPGNRLGFYKERGNGLLNTGKGALGKGMHEAVIVVTDVNGNESRVRFHLLVDAPPQITNARISISADSIYTIEAQLTDADDAVVEVELASSPDGETWKEVDRRQSRMGELKWRIHRGAVYWRVRALDPAGEGTFAICRLPVEADEEQAGEVPGSGFVVERRSHQDFVELVMRHDQVLSAAPRVRVGASWLDPQQNGLREFRVAVPIKPGDSSQIPVDLYAQGLEVEQVLLDRQLVRPGIAHDLSFYGGRINLRFGEASVYTPFFPQVEVFEPQTPEELLVASAAFSVGPEFSFDRKVEIRLRYEGGDWPAEKIGVYREVAEGKWVMVGNEWDAANAQVGAKLRILGRYALLADLVPPEIDALRPAAGKVVKARPAIRAVIRDRGAGIGREEDVELVLDGRPIIAEYDPDAGLVHGHLPEDLLPGLHKLLVRVRDMSGNQAEVRSEFEVR